MSRRRITLAVRLLAAAIAAACGSGPVATPTVAPTGVQPDVVELSAVDALARLRAGSLTSRALTGAYLQRIAALDKAGPAINAIIELNPNALADAAARDADRAAGRATGPLHGLPILIKDNIEVAGMVNSAGSLALATHRPARDAFLVDRLRRAGAVILGKTNLSEWANFRGAKSTSGWSSRGGQTKNPYVLDRNPCGSSSGSGAAVAASFAALAIGTETDGSIICPAAVNGIVGLKPTVGLVSRTGIIPISASQDTAGPMARSVADAALLLEVIAALDPADPAAADAAGHVEAHYTAPLSPDALAGRRFGLLRQAMGYDVDVDTATLDAVAKIRATGGAVIEVTLPGYGRWDDAELDVLLYEFKDGVNRYLRESHAPLASLEALIEWNRAHAAEVMPFFQQERFELAQKRGPLTEPAYLRARDTARRLARDQGVHALLDAHRLDALIAPSMSPAWLTDHANGDRFTGAGYGMAAVAGTPSLTIPIGDSQGLPLGLTFMGRAYGEKDLLNYAYALEQILQARQAPRFLPTLPAPRLMAR